MSTKPKLRVRSVVITIQNLRILEKIQWHLIPKLVRVTMQVEDKDQNGAPTSKPHAQAFLEFSDQVCLAPLRKFLPNVHLPDYQELQELRAKYPQGLKASMGRSYCSNPVKRVDDTPVMIYHSGKWHGEGAEFLAWLSEQSVLLHKEKSFEIPQDKMHDSFYMHDGTEWVEVLEMGTEKLRPKDPSTSEHELRILNLVGNPAAQDSLRKLRKLTTKP